MEEQRKYAILLAATILAARKLSDPDLKAWPRAAAIRDAIEKANQILEEIDSKWPNEGCYGTPCGASLVVRKDISSGTCQVRDPAIDSLSQIHRERDTK